MYKAEMHKRSRCRGRLTGVDELIDEIAVDLTRASPAKEAQAAGGGAVLML